MLWLLDTGKMAKKFGKWRSAITALSALGVFLIGEMILRIGDIVRGMSPATDDLSGSYALLWTTLGFYVLGVAIGLWALWLWYQDSFHEAYKKDAEHYEREGW